MAMENLKNMVGHLWSSPFEALKYWDYWLGFAAYEYAGDFVQQSALGMVDGDSAWRPAIAAVVRGGITAGTLSFWDQRPIDRESIAMMGMGGYAY